MRIKRFLAIFILFSVLVSCNKDDDSDESGPSQAYEYTYKGTTDQNEEIIIKVRGELITGIETRFIYNNIPGGGAVIGFKKYDSDGITTYTNKEFSYVFPDPQGSELIKNGSEIKGQLYQITFEGTYDITRTDNDFNIHGSFTAKLF